MTDEERAAIAAICVAHANRAPHVLATLRRPEWDSLELVHAREAYVKTYAVAIAAVVRELIADDVAELVAVVKLCGRAMREHAPELLPALVSHHRREVALAAIEVASERGPAEALLALVEHGADAVLVAAAIRALTALDREDVVRLARARWDVAEPELCEAIVIACEWFGSADEMLAVAAKHPDPRVRARAALAVRSPGVVAAEVPALEAALQRERDPATLLVYADVLQREGDPRGELIALGELDPARKRELALQWIGKPKLGGYAWNPRRIRDGLLDEYRGRTSIELLRSPAGRYLCGAAISLRDRELVAAFAAQPRPWIRRISFSRNEGDALVPQVLAAAPNLEEIEVPSGMTIAHPTARIVHPPPYWDDPAGDLYLSIGGVDSDYATFLEMVARQAELLSPEATATWREILSRDYQSRPMPGMRRALEELDDVGWDLAFDDEPVPVTRYQWSPY